MNRPDPAGKRNLLVRRRKERGCPGAMGALALRRGLKPLFQTVSRAGGSSESCAARSMFGLPGTAFAACSLWADRLACSQS